MTVPKVLLSFCLDHILSITILPAGTPRIRIHKPWLKHNSIFIFIFQRFFQNGKTIVLRRLAEQLEVSGKDKSAQMCFSKQEQGLTRQFTWVSSPGERESVVLAHISERVLLSTCLDLRKEPPVSAQET